jgi:hypothetical protein
MKSFKEFLSDEEAASSMVIKLVLAVTIAAAVMIIILQIIHANQDTMTAAADSLGNGTKNALTETMKTMSD